MTYFSSNLPSWLKTFIVNSLGGNYAPNHVRALSNLKNNHEQNLRYLGTYFPRTFSEMNKIMSDLYANTNYRKFANRKKTFRILSMGCGTGGDITGLIYALHSINQDASFEIDLFDGNVDAVKICMTILEKIKEVEHISIKINKPYFAEVDSTQDFEILAKKYSNLDIVVTSKFLNEILDFFPNAYRAFVEEFSKSIADDGLIILNDVTCQAINGSYIPTQMNKSLNQGIRQENIASILPLCCSANRDCNNPRCYSRFKNPGSYDYTFRVIGKIDFVKKIIPSVKDGLFLIDYQKQIYCQVIAS